MKVRTIITDERSYKRFLKHIKIDPLTNCWEWQAGMNNMGYGLMRNGVKGSKWNLCLAHRFSYQYHKGLFNGLQVLHKCDNPKCCNPDHLFLGTQVENLRDMRSKNRHVVPTKLKPDEVREIKKLLNSKTISQPNIAKLFNVSRSAIMHIHCGSNWVHII